MQPSLPLAAIDEAFDFADLVYVGPDPMDPDNSFLVGPHGIPVRLEYAVPFSRWKQLFNGWKSAPNSTRPRFQVMMTLPTLRVKVMEEGDVRFRMTYKMLAVRLMIDDPDTIPDDNRERALMLVKMFSDLTRPTAPGITNGSFEEMLPLFQDICDLMDKPFTLYSSHPEGYRASIVYVNQPLQKEDDFPAEIAAWFNPIGGRADLAQFRANERSRSRVKKFDPETLSAHGRIAAGGRVHAWLTTHAADLKWSQERLDAVLAWLGIE